jgi:aryl carrier-like protein
MAARRGPALVEAHGQLGVSPLPVEEALDAIEVAATAEAPPVFAVIDGDLAALVPDGARTEDRRPPDDRALERRLLELASAVLPRPLTDPDQSLLDAGLDSLGATSLRDALAREGVAVALATLLRGPSVREIVAEWRGSAAPAQRRPAAAPASAAHLALVLSLLAVVAMVGWVLSAR